MVSALAMLLGCVSSDATKKKPAQAPQTGGQAITEINLLAIPVALNFDQKPGPDGFVIKVFASNRQRPKPLEIESGRIEILMFDGAPGTAEGASFEPKRVWNYTAQELRGLEVRSSIGIGYQITAIWGEAKPAGNKISVVVRYTGPSGGSVVSAPSVISVSN